MSEPSCSAEDSAKSVSKSKTKRQRRKKQRNTQSTSSATASSSTSPVLPAVRQPTDGMAFVEAFRPSKSNGSSRKPSVRTGPVPVSEILGDSNQETPLDVEILRRLQVETLNKQSVLEAAIANMPPVPGFPSLLGMHRPDSTPCSSIFRPELFKTTMEAYAREPHAGNDIQRLLGVLPRGQTCAATRLLHSATESRMKSLDRPAPAPVLLPWFTQASHRMAPDTPNYGRGSPLGSLVLPSSSKSPPSHTRVASTMFRPNGTTGNRGNQTGNQQYRAHSSGSHAWASQSTANHNGQQQGGSQKTRKPYFMPYMSFEAVKRGLENTDLFEGILRVNQRNYEESYVDNPDGDDQLDILILGVHDRNRALHGDVVVVKIKERREWVVRDNLYQAWKSGTLANMKDENGMPLVSSPLPPVKSKEPREPAAPVICVGGVSLTQAELEEPVELDPKGRYSRKHMIRIGAQMEVAAQQEDSVFADLPLEDRIREVIETLAIAKTADESASNASPLKKISAVVGSQKRPSNHNANRRTTYRLLCDVAENESDVPDACLQKTAEVVFISAQKNCRAAMGQLKMMADGNRNWALFSPTDSRMPRMMIPAEQLPIAFFDRPQDYSRYLFVARMMEWQATAQFARGRLEKQLGLAGDVEVETEGLLYSNDVDTREFSQSALSSLPISEASEWKIDEKEFKYRLDLREETIFTIDPLTARDLDDALSIKPCDDIDGKGTKGWEVGVHIADVSHFLIEQSELDLWAADRATSVYLVHKVIPMLPRILCEELCSLNPGVDRLAFSVVWKMNDEAQIFSEWFGRTIIRSCIKMAYEHAQDIIEHPEKEFKTGELPEVFNGKQIGEIRDTVLQLHRIARKLNARRMENGALRLDQPRLKFSLDNETKMPNGVSVYERKDSNSLVEEFMLLANMAVARKIESAFPKISLLRRHPPPKQKVMREVLELCDKIGFPLDSTSAGHLSNSLHRFSSDNEVKAAINQVLSMLMMRPMQLAVYFCTGSVKSRSEYHHYALSAPFYTHFTSPIRRYADVMVHRLLAAALGYTPMPSRDTVEAVSKEAQVCNDKKVAAKTVSDASADTFFGLFVKQCGPIEERGVVVNVLDASFDVLVFKFGTVKRVYVNRLEMAREPVFTEGPPPKLTLFWKARCGGNAAVEQVIQMCTVVDVVLAALPEPTKYQAVIRMRGKGESKTLRDLFAEDAKSLSASPADIVEEEEEEDC